ncbi:MAG: helix-turn-helix transcriptional regulator [Bacteroidota bacterium]
MEPSYVIIAILLCLGAFQGIIFGIILWNKERPNSTPNRWLAAILFFLSYRLIVQVLRLFGIGYYDFWYHIMLDYSWINGPLLFFYVKSYLDPDFRLGKKDWIHFLPVAIQFICSNFVRTQNFFWDGSKESLSWLGYWGYSIWMNYPTIYLIASILIIFYSSQALSLFKTPPTYIIFDEKRVTWIRRILLAFIVYFSIVFVLFLADLLVVDISASEFGNYFYFTSTLYFPFFIGLAGLTYWLGLSGFARKDELPFKRKTSLSKEEEDQLKGIASRLDHLMESEKAFTDPDLSLSSLAEKLDIKSYLLTKCLKEIYGKKFNDYINGLRIEEVKNLLRKPESQNFTLLSLALDAGFNSKSSFNRSVKKLLGISPSELREQL